jgi:hypothetical protein
MNPIVGIDRLAAALTGASTAGAVYQLVAARAVQRFAARTAVDSNALGCARSPGPMSLGPGPS